VSSSHPSQNIGYQQSSLGIPQLRQASPGISSRSGQIWLRQNHFQLSAHRSTDYAVITKHNSATNKNMYDAPTQLSGVT
jgi:hypothetical protein